MVKFLPRDDVHLMTLTKVNTGMKIIMSAMGAKQDKNDFKTTMLFPTRGRSKESKKQSKLMIASESMLRELALDRK